MITFDDSQANRMGKYVYTDIRNECTLWNVRVYIRSYSHRLLHPHYWSEEKKRGMEHSKYLLNSNWDCLKNKLNIGNNNFRQFFSIDSTNIFWNIYPNFHHFSLFSFFLLECIRVECSSHTSITTATDHQSNRMATVGRASRKVYIKLKFFKILPLLVDTVFSLNPARLSGRMKKTCLETLARRHIRQQKQIDFTACRQYLSNMLCRKGLTMKMIAVAWKYASHIGWIPNNVEDKNSDQEKKHRIFLKLECSWRLTEMGVIDGTRHIIINRLCAIEIVLRTFL